MKRAIIEIFRWGFPVGIVIWLMRQADQSFAQLRDEPKNWSLLAAALVVCFAAVLLTIVRWYFLVRALSLPFSFKDALRLGFLGYLFNFVSLGSVGGDLIKAIFVAREQPGRRAEAVATVVVDRVLGLYAIFLLASIAILATGLWWQELTPTLRVLCRATFWCTLAGSVAILILFMPAVSGVKVSSALARIPKIGHTCDKLLGAVRIYRTKYAVLCGALVLSVAAQLLFCLGIYLIADGLMRTPPSLAAHTVVVPLGMITGVLPLPVNGLGAFEYVVEYLYMHLPGTTTVPGQGLVVSLAYRVISVVIALVGVGIYLASRREVNVLMHDAAVEQEAERAAAEHSGDATTQGKLVSTGCSGQGSVIRGQ